MIDNIIDDLGANYSEEDYQLLESILERVTTVAQTLSNNKTEEINPYIETCVKAEYLSRGGEGMNSLSESGKSSSFVDNIEKMRNDIIKAGLRRFF
jgi:mitochondrial fission protein ELM1